MMNTRLLAARQVLLCLGLALATASGLHGCGGGGGTVKPPDPGTVSVVLRNSDSTAVATPSVGAAMIEVSATALDSARTLEINGYRHARIWMRSMAAGDYRLLVVNKTGFAARDTVAQLFLRDAGAAVTAQLVAICDAANHDQDVDQFTLEILDLK